MTVAISNVGAGSPERAIGDLKRELQKEGVLKAIKNSRFHEPRSIKKARKRKEYARRIVRSVNSARMGLRDQN